MSRDEIITLYKIGKSIDFITNQYYNETNRNCKKNYYDKGHYVVTEKEITKQEARHFVETTIFNYIKNL